MDSFFYIGLPYLSLGLLIVGTYVRMKHAPFTVSSLSSQILESKKLRYGSIAWHAGIFIILAGHLVAFAVPGVWQALTSNYTFLLIVETLGFMAAVLCVFGLGFLIARRLLTAKLQAVTTNWDLAILGLLLMQVLVGMSVALGQRWGAQWSTGTTSPYLWGILTFQPDMALVSDLPTSMKLHLGLAWVTFAIIPFTRLIHGFTLPLGYLFRLPQQVIWTTGRREESILARENGINPERTRRHLLKGLGGMAVAGVLLGVGVLGKLASYFKGQRLTRPEQTKLLEKKLARLEATGAEQALELERLQKDEIFVAKLGQLNDAKGSYFIDYQMRPALAFKGKNLLPVLLSAKCTHLGCTVGSEVDDKGRILCPCHISYFDIETGKPNSGAPAKDPLPKIGWLLKDSKGTIVASQDSAGNLDTTLDAIPSGTDLDSLDVWIARRFEEEA